jgi:predicted lactoylglutathione lyase
MAHQIFVNLPVKDLPASKDFWERLGFKFNPQFSDDKGAGLVIDEKNGIFVMLLTEEFFHSFIPELGITDARKQKEAIFALSCESKEKVDELHKKALDAGGTNQEEKGPEVDFMYGKAFLDLDGHAWELFFLDQSKMPATPQS